MYSELYTLGANATSCNDPAVDSGTTYYYRVWAYNGTAVSPYSNEAWRLVGCTPITCASVGAVCGTVSDGCGGTLTCGPCTGTGRKCIEPDGTWYFAGQHCEANKCVSNSCTL